MSIRFWAAAVVVASLTVAGCGTNVGKGGTNGGGPAPQVVITPIGYKALASNPISFTVRSGADVLLSGKDSDGISVALKTFTWKQTGGPALPALPDTGALLYRTANTVSFRAPNVTAATKLTFQLTVTNALNNSASANAEVTVVPASDQNQFLIPSVVDGAPPQRFEVAVATAEGLTGTTTDSPVCVKVSRQIQYRGRNQGPQDTPLVADLTAIPQLQADTAFAASVDAVAAVNGDGSSNIGNAAKSHTNPHVVLSIPTLNDEDLFAMFNQPVEGETSDSSSARQAKQLLAGDVDSAHVLLSVSATAGSCDGKTAAPDLQGKTLVLAILDDGGLGNVVLSKPGTINQDASGAALTSDSLITTVRTQTDAPAETLASATAYYKKIDPNSTKRTLDQWLDANCFDHTAADYGTGAAGANGAHAVYTNNFDLGFGRDMYFIKCAADHTDASGNVAHAGDMASVVINYPSLEQTALKQSPIIAVAMEYSADPGSNGPRYTKFYVFAPNVRDGGYTRVSSANFDKRGQKYVPGACLSCHGGKVTDATFANSGDVDASFMPWDLDALLYSDTDPSFLGNLVSGANYTRKAQEPNLQKLNALAWQTWQIPEPIPINGTGTCAAVTDPGCVDRYAAPIALVTQWYGGDPAAASAHPYDDSKTPDAWVINGQAAPNDLYHQAFAHQCRSCHTQLSVAATQFTDYPTFESSYITKDTSTTRVQETIYRKAQMPLARLTADRFWADYAGGTSAAQALANHIKNIGAHDQVVDGDGHFIPPGAPVQRGTRVAQVDASTPVSTATNITPDTTTGVYNIKRFDAAHVDLSGSPFGEIYGASLCLKQTADASDSTPCVPQPVPLIGGTTGIPAFNASNWGFYELQVTANNALGTPVTFSPIVINAPQTLPNINACAAAFANQSISISANPAVPQVLTLDVAQCATLGDTPQLQLLDPATGVWGTTALSTTTYAANLSAFKINFNFTQAATVPVTVSYRLCDIADNVCTPTGPVVVDISATYTALPRPYSMTLADNKTGLGPQANVLTIPVSCTGANAPPASCNTTAALTAGDTILPISDQFNLSLGAASTGTAAPAAQTTTLAQSGTITYTAPAGFVTCDINGKNINDITQPCAPVTFTYTLQSAAMANQSSQSNVTVKVNATTSFTQGGGSIFGKMTTCGNATCHDAALNKWTFTPGNPTATLASLKAGGCVYPGTGFSCIVGGNPSISQMYRNVCLHEATHNTDPQKFSAGDCEVLSQWIAEGAHLN